MHLTETYLTIVERDSLTHDPGQFAIVEAFDSLLASLPDRQHWLKRILARPTLHPKGVYLWGGVGRGKTWLMDMFYAAIPGEHKMRLHCHRFMQRVHQELSNLNGKPNPLRKVVDNLLGDIRVLCLDEFSVVDIGDAMLIAGVLDALFAKGVILVTTSNHPPDHLYMDGIQRASFLPAIALLNRHCKILELNSGYDYRRRMLESFQLYYYPLGDETDQRLHNEFVRLASKAIEHNGVMEILGRDIPFRQRASDLVWFDFEALCGPPRSQYDYIEVARCHHTVFISDIPKLDSERDDRTRRFIACIDEFYDRNVKVVLSANSALENLYTGERLRFEFQRTASRLQEMQTTVYLGRMHKG